ncbi:ABC transporter ATP-binding protein [Luethyella okanaganae]|uniref:ABC transporter ATP-binding protein n=1 Tax=Luethyella okanaganae TaxID=69372 RepID=A0ABW1VG65_9MICO
MPDTISAERATEARLRADDVTVGYTETPVLSGVTLDIPTGKITALIGANGCGKSTLLAALSRVRPPRDGTVLLDGASIARMPLREVAKSLTILPQTPIAPEGLTVRQLCRLGRNPHRGRFGRANTDDETIVSRAIAACGLLELQDRAVDELSGGQRQRAWIAVALAQDTPLLLLDEPTTYLDLAHQVEVLELLRTLNREHGRTIVMVLHDLNQAARYADHVVALSGGGIHIEGTPAETLTEQTIRLVYGLDCRIVPNPIDGTPLCIPL